MKNFTLTLIALGASGLTTADANMAEAAHGYYGVRNYGVHLAGRNFHFDIGRPHGYSTHRPYQSNRFHRSPHLRWHDTTHLDWHPGEYAPHGNHYDYIPGHYDVHHSGHWDRHGGHRRW